MKRNLLIIVLASVVMSCNQNSDSTKINSQPPTEEITESPTKIDIKAATTDSILVVNKVKHHFSNATAKDVFEIYIKGENINNGTVVFTITSNAGKELLREEFPSSALIDYGFEGNFKAVAEREKYMISRIKKFFAADNFKTPALESDAEFIEGYSERPIFDEIKNDQSAIGFFYSLYEEDGRSIAYSKKHNKVVMYFNCC